MKYYKQANLCCGGTAYLVVKSGNIRSGFLPACYGLFEIEPSLLPELRNDAIEISQENYEFALADVGL